MQTFLSNWDLTQNAALLDGKRLFKQLVEAATILDILINKKTGAWASHPATKQWRGFEVGLLMYITSIWRECEKRGIAKESKIFDKCLSLVGYRVAQYPDGVPIFPKWWGKEDILISHRSRLKCKGLADIYCAAIKKLLNIKNLDKWLKGRYGKTKNQLRYPDLLILEKFLATNGVPPPTNNHYDIPAWEKIPYDLSYIWG